MAKTREELNELKENLEALSGKLQELTPDELAQVTGGATSTPGVQITQPSARPGKGYRVDIRGLGTIGNIAPLYVIDGVAGGQLEGIDPNDIESIDVLKD